MTGRFEQAEAAFHAILGSKTGESRGVPSRRVWQRPCIEAEVRRLLAAHEQSGVQLDQPVSPEIEAEIARLKPVEAG
jgi:hypothetical protein